MIVLVAAGFVIAITAIAAVLEGWALSVMWGWFIVPFGVPALTIPYAIGVALVVGMLTHQTRKSDKDEWSEKLLAAFIGPPLIVCIGWIVHKFV